MTKNTNRKLFAASASAALVASAVVPTAALAEESTADFPDVDKDHEAAKQVNDLYNAGIITGYEDGTFKPGNMVTRAEVSKMVTEILDLDKNVENADFSDVKQDAWYSDGINALSAAGHIQGYEDGTFDPSGDMTRAEFAKLVVDAYDIPKASADLPFEDVKTNVWYTENIETLYAHGLIKGQSESKFGPNDTIKRIDLALLLANVDYEFGDKLNPDTSYDIEETNAIDPNTIEVTFAGLDKPVTIELEKALEDGDNEVTFEYEENEYTTTVNFDKAAYEEALAVEKATEAVEKAANSYKQDDIDEAQKLVNDLSESDDKVVLNHRLGGINDALDKIVGQVNKAVEDNSTNALDKALNQKPFENYDADNRNKYITSLEETETKTIADIQTVINDVNESVISKENNKLEETITDNLNDADITEDQKAFDEKISVAQDAIDKLPSDWTRKDDAGNEYNVKEDYQEQLDNLVSKNEDYVNRVKAVVEAGDDYAKKVALTEGNFDFVEDNLQDYDFKGSTTVEEIEYEISFVDAKQAINAFEVDANTTQADLDALKDMVPRSDKDEDGNPVANEQEKELITQIDNKETALENLEEATTNYNKAVTAAEEAQEAYLAAGGEKENKLYKKVTTELEKEVDMDNTEDINNVRTSIETATNSLTDETDALKANAEAIETAEKAQEAYLAAGGEETDEAYTAVSNAIEDNVLDTIKSTTKKLNDLTEDMELVNSINNAETPEALEKELVKLGNTTYNNLSKQQRLEVADAALKELAQEDADYTTLDELSNLLNDASNNGLVSDYNSNITNVNDAITNNGNNTDVREALNDLDIEEFNNLSANEKLNAAENVINNKPENGYNTISEIVAQF